MEQHIERINQYEKLSALFTAVNLIQEEIIKEEKKLQELQKESEKK